MSSNASVPATSAQGNPETLVASALLQAITEAARGGNTDRERNGSAADHRVVHQGDQIILPANPEHMSVAQAIEILEDIEEDDKTEVAINEVIRGYHYIDGTVAFNLAMKEVFGWTKAVTVRTFFGKHPPVSLDVVTGPDPVNDVERHLTGRFVIPGMKGYVETSAKYEDGIPVFTIQGETVKKHRPLIDKLAAVTRRIVSERSIFRGKAFELKFSNTGSIAPESPNFIYVADAKMPIFNRVTEEAVTANILNPIRYSEKCRALNIPLKRGVLLEGPYGTGKTMLSKLTAKVALENGWTFIKLNDAEYLPQAVKFARKFQPCVLFLEDLDEAIAGEDRDHKINNILNTIDGLDSKNSELMVVFTSNHADNINKAMMRPGRLDAIVPISPPDAEAAERLVRMYADTLIDPKADYSPVGEQLAGSSSAVIREVVERAKLFQFSVDDGVDLDKGWVLSPDALFASAETMQRQMDLLSEKKEEEIHPGQAFAEYIVAKAGKGENITEMLEDVTKRLAHVEQHVCN